MDQALERRVFEFDQEMSDIVERIKDRYGYTDSEVIEYLLELGRDHILQIATERLVT
jgi:hypothetical protein